MFKGVKSFDLNIKPYFIFKYFKKENKIYNVSLEQKQINLFNEINKLDDSNPLKFIKYIEIDITQKKTLKELVDQFLNSYIPMLDITNFKPIVIYPLCLNPNNLTMHDISNQFLTNKEYFKSEHFKSIIHFISNLQDYEDNTFYFSNSNNNNKKSGGYKKINKRKTNKKIVKRNKSYKNISLR